MFALITKLEQNLRERNLIRMGLLQKLKQNKTEKIETKTVTVDIPIGLFILIMSNLGPKFARDQRKSEENNFRMAIARFYLPRSDFCLNSWSVYEQQRLEIL